MSVYSRSLLVAISRKITLLVKVPATCYISFEPLPAGAGLWGTTQPISNNSALIADSAGQIGTIYCHSASEQFHIGRWISPAGNDITFTSTDAFDVGLHSGSFHSYTTLALSNGFSLSGADQGVYSCQIPDEKGIQNILHVGIYPHGYAGN